MSLEQNKNLEQFSNQEEITEQVEGINHDIEVDPEEIKKLEDLDAEIEFRTSETAEEIRKAQTKKGTEIEKWDSKPTTTFKAPTMQKSGHAKGWRNWILGISSLLTGLGASATKEAKAGGEPIDSLGKKNKIESVSNPTDSLMKNKEKKPFEQTISKEKFRHITIEGHIFVPQKDTSKEVYVYYFSNDGKEKDPLNAIISEMRSKGYEPADGELLGNVYNQNKNNPEFNKKLRWVIAPTPEDDSDDTRANEKSTIIKTETVFEGEGKEKVERKITKIETAIPSHAVLPSINPNGLGRFELNNSFSLEEGYGLMFTKKVEKEENTNQFDYVKSK